MPLRLDRCADHGLATLKPHASGPRAAAIGLDQTPGVEVANLTMAQTGR